MPPRAPPAHELVPQVRAPRAWCGARGQLEDAVRQAPRAGGPGHRELAADPGGDPGVKAGANSARTSTGPISPTSLARGRIGIVVHAGPGPSVEHSTVRRFCQERHNAEAARYEHAVHAASVPTRTAPAGAAVHGHRELARRLVELPQPYRVLRPTARRRARSNRRDSGRALHPLREPWRRERIGREDVHAAVAHVRRRRRRSAAASARTGRWCSSSWLRSPPASRRRCRAAGRSSRRSRRGTRSTGGARAPPRCSPATRRTSRRVEPRRGTRVLLGVDGAVGGERLLDRRSRRRSTGGVGIGCERMLECRGDRTRCRAAERPGRTAGSGSGPDLATTRRPRRGLVR